MDLTSRTGIAGIMLAIAGFFLILGHASPASADIERFWEKQETQPSLSGHRHQTAAVHASRHREASSDSDEERPRHRLHHARRVASLGGSDDFQPQRHQKSLSGGGVAWAASSSCLNGTLASIVQEVGASYGPVTVNSTCRSHSHNAAVGGAHHSQHLTGDAVDFRVHGSISGAIAFLRSNGSVGGFKHYGGGLFHIDTGPRRSW